ncbi:MAG: GreA/GreB family elongation factor [Candidatus Nomurabacteria bacterium]|nr:MAG: GreA/GreB family elongation factor [Candidatus Nomurabacteria bacterium]
MDTNKTTYLSKKGMKDLKKAVEQLERDRRQTILELHEQDKTDGHEERLARIEKLAKLDSIEQDLIEKQTLLATAKPYPHRKDSHVDIGSVVELINASGRRFIYTIVDSIEADPSDGRISAASPLGQSLMGKSITDTVNWGDAKKNKLQLVRIS